MRNKTLLIGVIGIVIGVLLSTAVVFAGNLDPAAGPADPSSQMVTLQQLWDRINNGAAATKMSAFTEPSAGPGSTMKTLDDLYTLASERSRPAKTGQTTPYRAGDDGALQKGVAWPSPRFTDNANGTVTDNLTGLIWLKNANCLGAQVWYLAVDAVNELASGSCGLSDGSTVGAWRLPNAREMQSLIDYGRAGPALPSSHPFTGVLPTNYWTSTSAIVSPLSYAWFVDLNLGRWDFTNKGTPCYVWPVRGGQ